MRAVRRALPAYGEEKVNNGIVEVFHPPPFAPLAVTPRFASSGPADGMLRRIFDLVDARSRVAIGP
jgi:hypothetical protein